MPTLQRQSTGKKKRAEAALREHIRNKRIVKILVFFIVVVLVFMLGFFVRGNSELMTSLGFLNNANSKIEDSVKVKSVFDDISMRIDEVEKVLEEYSLDKLDLDEATQSMLTDMMTSANDPYAEYFNPERYERYIKETQDKQYSGIGVLFGDYNGRAYAVDVFSESEAAAKGVTQGDFVLSVNGDSSHDWTMMEIIGAISESKDQNIVITWMRPVSLDASTGSEFTTTLECHPYAKENLTTELNENIGYIKLRQITPNSASLVTNAIKELTNEGAESFILDIRNNPGGYLTQSLNIASLFVKSGVLVNIETVDGTSSRTATGVTITDAPLVVLINKYTSASAEVLAGALADNKRAVTVGQTTMGKGSVQVVRELSFGGAIRYTAAYYETPSGRQINKAGIIPEISVSSDDETDTQLLIAYDTAHSLID